MRSRHQVVVVAGRERALGFRQVARLDQADQVNVAADRAPLDPPQAEPDRLERPAGDPRGREQVTRPAADEGVAADLVPGPGGYDRADDVTGDDHSGDAQPPLAL